MTVETPWTNDMLAELRRHFDAGTGGLRIAEALGISKGSVLGKIHRLGWERGQVFPETRWTYELDAELRTYFDKGPDRPRHRRQDGSQQRNHFRQVGPDEVGSAPFGPAGPAPSSAAPGRAPPPSRRAAGRAFCARAAGWQPVSLAKLDDERRRLLESDSGRRSASMRQAVDGAVR